MSSPPPKQSIPLWRDERALQILAQGVVAFSVIGVIYWLYANMTHALDVLNLPLSLHFLELTSGFDIGQTFIEYSRSSTYLQAYYVGVLNTLVVAFWGNIFATVLGVIVGVAWLSSNWLVSRLARIYIEIFRNVPLLVFLVFWYGGLFLKFPNVRDAITFGPIFFSNRGVSMPWGIPSETFQTYLYVLGAGVLSAWMIGFLLTQQGKKTGRMPLVTFWSLLTFLGVALVGWFVFPTAPLTLDLPALPKTGFNIEGGHTFASEFMALLSGLILYTAAFIGEVVRAGIQAVSKGQTEASKALGLTGFQTLRLVVFPQAMRVIIPPLTSQYLNLTKNSSLAVAIGYPDLVMVYGTIINQSGRAVEMTAIMMATYLTFSLLTSALLNAYNKRMQLVER